MLLLFIYAAVFVSALVFFELGIRQLMSRRSASRFVNQRLEALEGEIDRKKAYKKLLDLRGVSYSTQSRLTEKINVFFAQTGLMSNDRRIFTYGFAIAVPVFLFCYFLFGFGPTFLFVSVLALVAVLAVAVAYLRQKRISRFVSQLPVAIDVMVRSLAAGHPVPTSIGLVAREMPDPIGSEFGFMSDEMTYGTEVDAAVRNMVQRVGADELNLLAVSLSVQKGTGGNLGEILSNLAGVLRSRSTLRQKIKAISAEGRMTSWVMLVFPFGLYTLISLIAPTYFDPLWESGYGPHAVAVGMAMLFFGMLILRRIVNFDY
jgi:tight adherence protein B